MKKTLLTLATTAMTAWTLWAQAPASPTGTLTFAPSMVGQSVRLGLAADGDFAVDWGDGTVEHYTSGSYYTHTLMGTEMKLYGDYVQIVANGAGITAANLDGCTNMIQLQMTGNELNSLDVSHMRAMTGLYVHTNQLTSLDVSLCTALRVLDVHENKIEGTIDCSGMNNLSRVDVADNLLTGFVLPKQSVLGDVDCRGNQLTELDVAGLTGVSEINCQGNQLSSLDLTGLTSLEELYAYENQLTDVDVTPAQALKTLNLSDNLLTAIDLSSNKALEGIYLYNNQLTDLNMDGLTAVRWLNVENNQLAEIDTRAMASLSLLRVSGNQLTELDLSGNSGLYTLYAANNRLTGDLMIGNETPNVYDLDVSHNELELLHVYNLNNLYYLQANDNRLQWVMGTDKHQYLYRLAVENNNLETLEDLRNNPYLQSVTMHGNTCMSDATIEMLALQLPDLTGKTLVQADWAGQFTYSCYTDNSLPWVIEEAEGKGWTVTEHFDKGELTAIGDLADTLPRVVRTTYYDASGNRLAAEPSQGFYIACDVLDNGTTVSRKVMK